MNKGTNYQSTLIAFFLGSCLLLATIWDHLSFDGGIGFICLGFALINIASLAFFLIHGLLKRQIPQSFYPLIVTLGFFALSFCLDSQNLWHLDFHLRHTDFNKIIALAENGQIRPNEYGFADLPDSYDYLSDGGSIDIREDDGINNILFYRSRGILGEYTGYMYRSGDGSPQFKDGCDYVIKQLEPHWFFCASY